jgi:hypothetical protein
MLLPAQRGGLRSSLSRPGAAAGLTGGSGLAQRLSPLSLHHAAGRSQRRTGLPLRRTGHKTRALPVASPPRGVAAAGGPSCSGAGAATAGLAMCPGSAQHWPEQQLRKQQQEQRQQHHHHHHHHHQQQSQQRRRGALLCARAASAALGGGAGELPAGGDGDGSGGAAARPLRRIPFSPWILGQPLAWGFLLGYILFMLALPIAALLTKASLVPLAEFWARATEPVALSAYYVSFSMAIVAAVINAFFGFILAWVLVKYNFPGGFGGGGGARAGLAGGFGSLGAVG